MKGDEPTSEASNKPKGEDKSKQTFGMVTRPMTTSTTTPRNFSQAELVDLKAKNPAYFLKAMMNATSSSSEKGGTSSTIFWGKPVEKSSKSILLQIKEKLFGIDLIQSMNDNVNVCFGLKDLMKKVDVLSVSGEVSKLLIALGFLLAAALISS